MGKSVVKPVMTPEEAIRCIKRGSSVMVGGFNYGGIPYTLVDALLRSGADELTLIGCDVSYDDSGHGRLVAAGRVKKAIAAYVGSNKKMRELYNEGLIELELVPMGTFAERVRCGGYGLGGILTPTGVGTVVEEGKRVIEIDGKKFLLELPLRADVALIRAHKADRGGSLTYLGTHRNFNPLMAFAADRVIAEVDEIVEIGGLSGDQIMTPGILIDALVLKGETGDAFRV